MAVLTSSFYFGEFKLHVSKQRVCIKQKRRLLFEAKIGEYDVVVVGGGVCGLATAASLHRVGLKSIVLERSSSLREGGAALSLWGNGWKALEAIGVAEKIRSDYSPLTNVQICSKSGDVLRSFTIEECVASPHEVRGVHRTVLLKTLSSALPSGSVRYNATPENFSFDHKTKNVKVSLKDGEEITAKVLLGCDGGRSSVAKWLGKSPPSYCGYSALRGIASFPEGHSLGSTIQMVWGQGIRAGMYPLNDSEVYWFTCFNLPQGEIRKFSGEEMKSMALDMVKGWAFGVTEVISKTPDSAISFSAISDSWTLPLPGSRWGRDSVTLLGDAAHPMTPNLGQGACTALEDAIVLTQKLASVSSIVETKGQRRRKLEDGAKIAQVLEEFDKERIWRTAPLTVRSYAMGAALQIPYAPICFLRDKVALPIVLKTDHFLDHALFDCGSLPV